MVILNWTDISRQHDRSIKDLLKMRGGPVCKERESSWNNFFLKKREKDYMLSKWTNLLFLFTCIQLCEFFPVDCLPCEA